MSIFDCDYESDSEWGYRERIEISDGTTVCCESNITIPKGQPFAACWVLHVEAGDWGAEYADCFDDLSEADQMKAMEKHGHLYPQCIEVWRLLRINNRRRGACASFGNAVSEYWETMGEVGPEMRSKAALMYRGLIGGVNKARARYALGRGPRLHPSEQESVENQEWKWRLPFMYGKGETRSAEAS